MKWLEVLGYAEKHPGALVLRFGGCRASTSEGEVVALKVRLALITHASKLALNGVGFSIALHRVGWWPKDDAKGDSARACARLVSDWVKYFTVFTVEDVESLDCLLDCCVTRLWEEHKKQRFSNELVYWLAESLIPLNRCALEAMGSKSAELSVAEASEAFCRLQIAQQPERFAELNKLALGAAL